MKKKLFTYIKNSFYQATKLIVNRNMLNDVFYTIVIQISKRLIYCVFISYECFKFIKILGKLNLPSIPCKKILERKNNFSHSLFFFFYWEAKLNKK